MRKLRLKAFLSNWSPLWGRPPKPAKARSEASRAESLEDERAVHQQCTTLCSPRNRRRFSRCSGWGDAQGRAKSKGNQRSGGASPQASLLFPHLAASWESRGQVRNRPHATAHARPTWALSTFGGRAPSSADPDQPASPSLGLRTRAARSEQLGRKRGEERKRGNTKTRHEES